MSMGGHVESGESYEEALARELMEKLKIDVQKTNCELLGYLTPHRSGVSAFMKIYRVKTNSAPAYNEDDFWQPSGFHRNSCYVDYVTANPRKAIWQA